MIFHLKFFFFRYSYARLYQLTLWCHTCFVLFGGKAQLGHGIILLMYLLDSICLSFCEDFALVYLSEINLYLPLIFWCLVSRLCCSLKIHQWVFPKFFVWNCNYLFLGHLHIEEAMSAWTFCCGKLFNRVDFSTGLYIFLKYLKFK